MVILSRNAIIIAILVIIIIIIILILISCIKPQEKDCRWLDKPKLKLKYFGSGDFTLYWNEVMKGKKYDLFVTEDKTNFETGEIIENVSSPYNYKPTDPTKTYYFLLKVTGCGCETFSNLVDGRVMYESSNPEKKEDKIEVSNNILPPPPVLRCYDFFEFPNEGGFRVNTCSSGSSDTSTRIFIQWFPVDGTEQYNVYCNNGINVSKTNYNKSWVIPGSSHYFETEPFPGNECWSIAVTSINKNGESDESSIYTTCGDQ